MAMSAPKIASQMRRTVAMPVDGINFHEQFMVPRVVFRAQVERRIEKNRIACEQEGLGGQNPGEPLVNEIVLMLHAAPNAFKNFVSVVHRISAYAMGLPLDVLSPCRMRNLLVIACELWEAAL